MINMDKTYGKYLVTFSTEHFVDSESLCMVALTFLGPRAKFTFGVPLPPKQQNKVILYPLTVILPLPPPQSLGPAANCPSPPPPLGGPVSM